MGIIKSDNFKLFIIQCSVCKLSHLNTVAICHEYIAMLLTCSVASFYAVKIIGRVEKVKYGGVAL